MEVQMSHFVAALASSFVLAAWLTSQTSSDLKPRFEVATIKANRVRISALNKAGNRFAATGQPLRSLIAEAYRVRNFQILGGPNWIDDDQWDIEAKAEPGVILTWTESQNPYRAGPLARMLQSLIEDRFRLKFHLETKEVTSYELTIARGGSKLKLSADQNTIVASQTKLGPGFVEVNAQPFANFVYFLQRQLDHPVIDKTDLKGLYDVKLQWRPDPLQGTPTLDLPTIFTALQEQLGLRLESGKHPVDMFVIDSVQRPSEN